MRWLALAASVTLAGGIAMVAPAALAGVSGSPDFTNANGNPVAGYYATSFGSTLTHINSYVGLQYDSNKLKPTTLPLSPSAAPPDGIGDQLCNDNTGTALQVGAVYLTGNKFAIAYGVGTFRSTGLPANVQNNGDPCEDGLLLNNAVASISQVGVITGNTGPLSAVPYGDTVEVQIEYNNNGHFLAGCGTDAEVLGSIIGSNHWYDTCITLPPFLGFNEAASGVESQTTGLSAPAVNQLDGNAHFTLTDVGRHHGFADNSPYWGAVPVDSTGSGVGPAGESLLEPGPISNGNFSVFEGTPTG
jgi:hypothetical protein